LIKEKLYDEDFLLKYTNAPQLIRADNNESLKDKEGHYLTWDTIANSVKPILKVGKKNGLTLGIDKEFIVSIEGKVVKCKTVFQMFAEKIKNFIPENSSFSEKIIKIARELGKNNLLLFSIQVLLREGIQIGFRR